MVQNKPRLKVAIVCDWLTGIGGAERVVLELHKMFPEAPIYTSQYSPEKLDWFNGADVRTGWLQKVPIGLKKFMPVLRAWYFSRLDLSEYDLIISETGAEAKAVKFREDARHICICNTPTHYYWSRYDSYLENPGFPKGFNWLARLGLKILVKPLRHWDYKAAQKPSELIAISTHIQAQIKKYYKRDSQIVFPPVDISRFTNSRLNKKRQGFVITGRQTPYKRIDLAVKACTELNLPLQVIGNGPDHKKLLEIAGDTIEFITDASDADITKYLKQAEAFIFPGLDDFGIAPVEALASGTPVIAYRGGGALDYVIPGRSGEFFDKQTTQSLVNALMKFRSKDYHHLHIQNFARNFSNKEFAKSLKRLLK